MSSQLTHERCSELLADYLARELEPEQHRLVENHLEHCAQCSAERAGLRALVSGKSEGLTGDERVALRAAVLGSTLAEEPAGRRLDDESDAVVVPIGGRGSRASKYLGIAAMLGILAVGSLFVFKGGGLGMTGSDDETGDGGSAASTAEDSGGQAGGEDEALGDSERESSPYSSDAWNTGLSYQSDRGAISADELGRLGRRNFESARSGNLTSDTAEPKFNEERLSKRAPEDQLERLAARVPGDLAPDIAACGRTALDELGRPGLATYATTATLDGTDVMIIGFVTGDRVPDRYAVFAFPLGDCTTILTSTEGPLE